MRKYIIQPTASLPAQPLTASALSRFRTHSNDPHRPETQLSILVRLLLYRVNPNPSQSASVLNTQCSRPDDLKLDAALEEELLASRPSAGFCLMEKIRPEVTESCSAAAARIFCLSFLRSSLVFSSI